MDLGSIIGIVLAFLLIVISIILGGGSVIGMIDPQSMMIVVGGTFGAVLVCFPMARVLKVHAVVLKAFFSSPTDPVAARTRARPLC